VLLAASIRSASTRAWPNHCTLFVTRHLTAMTHLRASPTQSRWDPTPCGALQKSKPGCNHSRTLIRLSGLLADGTPIGIQDDATTLNQAAAGGSVRHRSITAAFLARQKPRSSPTLTGFTCHIE
jgi:hypothetical protein